MSLPDSNRSSLLRQFLRVRSSLSVKQKKLQQLLSQQKAEQHRLVNQQLLRRRVQRQPKEAFTRSAKSEKKVAENREVKHSRADRLIALKRVNAKKLREQSRRNTQLLSIKRRGWFQERRSESRRIYLGEKRGREKVRRMLRESVMQARRSRDEDLGFLKSEKQSLLARLQELDRKEALLHERLRETRVLRRESRPALALPRLRRQAAQD